MNRVAIVIVMQTLTVGAFTLEGSDGRRQMQLITSMGRKEARLGRFRLPQILWGMVDADYSTHLQNGHGARRVAITLGLQRCSGEGRCMLLPFVVEGM